MAADPVDRVLSALTTRGLRPRKSGSGWTARCPGHDDRRPSLSIGVGSDGRALVTCFGGCTVDAILAGLDLQPKDLFVPADSNGHGHAIVRRPPAEPDPLPNSDALAAMQQKLIGDASALGRLDQLRGWTPEAIRELGLGRDGDRIVIPIHSATGELANVLRYWPNPETRGDRRKTLSLTGRPRDLFPAPETVAEGDGYLWIVEGEPDAVRAHALGLAAVAYGGVNNWRPEYASRFCGRRVAVVMDADAPGRREASKIATALTEHAAEVRLVDLHPDCEDGADLTNFAAGATSGELREQARRLLQDIAAASPIITSGTAVTSTSITTSGTNAGRLDLGIVPPTSSRQLRVVTLDEFVVVEEEGATALLGDADNPLIPENGDVMIYGDGGAGKTTLAIDLVCHLAAGDDWLGIPIARPVRALLIENEGPRPMFRAKLRRKREAWQGSPLDDRILVLDEPWSQLTLAADHYRQELADIIVEHSVDVVVLGPVTRSGMNEAGTLQEVRDFMLWIADVRRRAGRPVVFVLVHHENKGGKVSGAWEGAGDTLLHVQGQGTGSTRLYVQKARWSSKHHAKTLPLVWTPGEGFALNDVPERDDDTIADEILDAIRANGGTTWTPIEKSIAGKAERLRDIRDRLLIGGRLFNTGTDSRTKLWCADDPALQAHRPVRDDSGTTSPSTPEEKATSAHRPPSHPKGDGDEDDSLLPRSSGEETT